jgi:hypothetical protein
MTFQHLGAACARVLARQQAIRLAKDELARQGIRVRSVPARDIQMRADELLAAHPELVERAAQRVSAEPERWLPKRALRSVSVSGVTGVTRY